MTIRAVFVFLLIAYALAVAPYTSYLKGRPAQVKLGYTPDPGILKMATGEYRNLVADLTVMRVIFYFGTILDIPEKTSSSVQPEVFNMYKTVQTALFLDPYNNDAYYFSQAVFTWEIGHAADVNLLLDYGMRYRTWDYWLPFYAGFNAAYFLKDYAKAAQYMKRAADISGQQQFINLAAAYFHQAKQTDLGLAFLDVQIKNTKDRHVKQMYITRREALAALKLLTDAVTSYRKAKGRPPENISSLVAGGFLPEVPVDPFGGKFFIGKDGKVMNTREVKGQPRTN